MAAYEVKVVDRDGTVVRTLVAANVETVVENLDPIDDSVTVTFPKHDPPDAVGQAADVVLLKRELQVFRDGDLIAWGVPVARTMSSSSGSVSVTVPGVGWYLTRRFVDKPRENHLLNPQFEDDLDDWTSVDLTSATAIASPRVLDTQAVRLVGPTTGDDQFLRQTFTITGTAIGTNVVIAAYFILEAFTGPALEARGLYVEGREAGVFKGRDFAPVDASTPVDEVQRAEVLIWVPPLATWDIDVRLYAPEGTIVWDAVQAVIPESLAAFDEDLAGIAADVVGFVQDPTAGKSDLNLATDTPATGVTLTQALQFTDHTPADTALGALTDRDDGFEWSIEFPDTASRVFTTHHPRRGVDRTATVTLELGVNLASYELGEDGAGVETDVTFYGDGDGPDREEGRAVDTSELDGLVLQGVYRAPTGTPIDSLRPMAAARLAVGKRVARNLSVVTVQRSGDLVSLLRAGDLVEVVIDDGAAQVSGAWRIVRRELRPRTETLALALNEVL